jgi:tRNA (cytidine/uridine-2'-O-)-methyltransferase
LRQAIIKQVRGSKVKRFAFGFLLLAAGQQLRTFRESPVASNQLATSSVESQPGASSQRPEARYKFGTLEMTQTLRNDMNSTFERHIVLVSPEIHWNTGNIGRTCVATGTYLHLIKPLGFSLESKEVKRAGLDYWKQVKLRVWEDFDHFHLALTPTPDEVAIFSKTGTQPFWDMPSPPRQFLIFCSETGGLSPTIRNQYPCATYHIPITKDIRSLNLSTAVGIALYESLRSMPRFHAWAV